MRRYRLFTFIGQGFVGVFRNGVMSTASIFVLASTLVLMGCFVSLILNINLNLDTIDDFNEIVCYIELNSDDETIKAVGEAIGKLKNVETYRLVSKEEALESERERYGEEYAHLFDDYGEGDSNPLPDSYRVTYLDVEDADVLTYQISQIEGIEKVKNRLDIANNIQKVKNVISITSLWLMALLFSVSIFVIGNTIKLAFNAREREISIMRYIGATKFYITMPFIFEGLFIGLAAGIISYFAQWYIYTYLINEIINDYGMISIIPFSSLAQYFLIAFFGGGVLIGVLGSSFSIRRYMKV